MIRAQREIQAGIFLISTLVIFSIGIWFLGQERQIFARQEIYNTTFRDVKGLSEGAPVRLGGITVGRVQKIGFSPNIHDQKVHVTMLINEKYLERIRKDSVVTIETQGLLGDRLLSISSGKSNDQLLPGTSLLSHESRDIESVLTKAGTIVDNTVEISQTVNDLLTQFKAETLDQLTRAGTSIANLSTEIETGNGLMHQLIYSKKDGDTILTGLSKASANIQDITEQIKTKDNFLHSLLYDPSGKGLIDDFSNAAKNLSITSASLNKIMTEIETGSGILHDAIYSESPEGISDILDKLNLAAAHIEEASSALSSGTGTLGALLVDSKLYDNLVEVTDGAKRSFILRQAIKRTMKDKN